MPTMIEESTAKPRFTFAGSTAFVLLAILSWAFTVAQGRFFPKFVDMPVNVSTLIVFLVWPATSLVAAIWSATNLVRSRRAQFGLELFLAICSVLMVYYIVIEAPIGS